MEMDALLDTLNWIRPKADITNAQLCNDNCNMVLMNLFFYGQYQFELIRNKILALQPAYSLLTFHFLNAEFLQEGILTDPINNFGFTRNSNQTPFTKPAQLEDFAKI